ncbi:MAG TPA: HAD-IA family hydrolase [Clostridiaceae bacterium]|nr:HAD-IA family hydrolase [Clostridiaceae bacterium]
MIKYLIFDFDGTIVDSASLYLNLCNELAEQLNKPKIDMDTIRSMSSMTIKERCKKMGIPLYKLPSLSLIIQDKIKHHVDKIQWMDGMEEVLYKLKNKGYKLLMISSNSVQNINHFLKSKNADIFEDIYTSKGLFDKSKSINKLLKKRHLKKEEVIYIGDEYRDIIACKKSRIKIISVTWGYDSKDLLLSRNPDYIVDSPSELYNLILEL